jgi:hypothetical protein
MTIGFMHQNVSARPSPNDCAFNPKNRPKILYRSLDIRDGPEEQPKTVTLCAQAVKTQRCDARAWPLCIQMPDTSFAPHVVTGERDIRNDRAGGSF